MDAARIVLHPPTKRARFRWEVETMGLTTALVDLALSDLPGVVVEVPNVPRAPGAWDTLPVASEWTAHLDLGDDPEALAVRLRLCAGGDCVDLERVATRGHPEAALPGLMRDVADRMGLTVPDGAAEVWAAPLSADDYAVLVAGRSAATFYGLREPAAPEVRWDKVRDPVARAVYIDPAVTVAQWIAGRSAAADGDWGRARVSFTSAALGRPTSPQPAADEAAALLLLENHGAASEAWNALLELRPGDPRFLLPQARAALASGAVTLANELVEKLALRHAKEPAVAELRVRVADRSGAPVDLDGLLAAWQEADPRAAEPVRRRIHIRIRGARYEEALALIPALAVRGRAEEADQLRMAVAVGLGRWDEAALAADALGDVATAARIRGRGALESGLSLPDALDADADPDVRLVTGQALLERGDASGALERASAVLKREPWRPEALALQARALRALGKVAEAEKVERVLGDVEPGT